MKISKQINSDFFHFFFYRLKEVFSEQPNNERQNIYFIFEYVEQDLEKYLKMNNPLKIDQIRVMNAR